MREDNKQKILEMIYQNQLSAEEGLKLYQNKQADSGERLSARQNTTEDDKIAIIGMTGVFPEAEDVEQFWTNLLEGRDSVREIKRWDTNAFYDPIPQTPNKSYCKWGGLLDRIDLFDPLFFNLSPKQAELMEPRQRIFLQGAWNLIEDAGYSATELEGKKCGVFVGCEGSTDYFDQINNEKADINVHYFLGNSNSVLASRISYHIDINGPTVTIDTACSSSLVAIHLACESIKSGDSDMAIAGGVAINTQYTGYILMSSMGAISPTGKCKAFDDSADGFIPGEGMGAILLKPLKAAIRDNDNIYGVIKGSGINQDGKTNGITAPSAASQVRLETQVYEKFGIDPSAIGYIEAHGTGTKLGDPIEFDALTTTFRRFTQKKNYCGLGSVKTNIGHLGAAAGIAGVIKVLLALKYKTLPPSLHFEKPNDKINLQDSPFYVVTQPTQWYPVGTDKRMAAVSAFGHGGTNCHIVLEEAPTVQRDKIKFSSSQYLILVSAKSELSMQKKLMELSSWLVKQGQDKNLLDIQYTLAVGRSHFDIRSAFVITDKQDMIKSIMRLLENNPAPNYACSFLPNITSVEDNEPGFENLMQIASAYAQGNNFDWKQLFDDTCGVRIPMPTYPFDTESYWLTGTGTVDTGKSRPGIWHPLVQTNISVLEEQRFSSVFSGEEFFLKDHVLMNQKLLPAVSYIEMARAAGEFSTERKVTSINNIIWAKPVISEGEPLEVMISVAVHNGSIIYEVFTSGSNGQRTIHSRGGLSFGGQNDRLSEATLDLIALKARMPGTFDPELLYNHYSKMDYLYGKSMRTIKNIWLGKEEALAYLDLNQEYSDQSYVLHPGIMDGALQSVAALVAGMDTGEVWAGLPFSLGCIEIKARVDSGCYAYVTFRSEETMQIQGLKKFDIVLLNDHGDILAKIYDLGIRELKDSLIIADQSQNNHVMVNKNIYECSVETLIKQFLEQELSLDEADELLEGLSC